MYHVLSRNCSLKTIIQWPFRATQLHHPMAIQSDPDPRVFNIIHASRKGRKDGGIVVISRDSLQPRLINITGKYKSLEVCCVHLAIRTGHLNLIVLYRSSKSVGFFDDFQGLLDEIAALPGGLIVCGDFNCPSSAVSHVDKLLKRIINDFDLFQHVRVLTHRHDEILNLIIKSPENPTIIDVDVEDMGFPDYFMVTATLSDVMPRSVCTSHEARNIKDMDMSAFLSRLLASSILLQRRAPTSSLINCRNA